MRHPLCEGELKVRSSNIRYRSTARATFLSGLLLTPALWGCGKQQEPWEKVFPARGVVTYKGNPLAGAELAFFPEDESIPDSVRPRARTTADGGFVVWTYEQGDGAPAGSYKVTVVHHEVGVSNDIIVAKPNHLPAKYSRRESTNLHVEIDEGETELEPLDLQ
jgi:hypothetical protein